MDDGVAPENLGGDRVGRECEGHPAGGHVAGQGGVEIADEIALPADGDAGGVELLSIPRRLGSGDGDGLFRLLPTLKGGRKVSPSGARRVVRAFGGAKSGFEDGDRGEEHRGAGGLGGHVSSEIVVGWSAVMRNSFESRRMRGAKSARRFQGWSCGTSQRALRGASAQPPNDTGQGE